MSKTFIVKDQSHPLFGQRIDKFDGKKGRKWPHKSAPFDLTEPKIYDAR